jgi:hypothetical protein
MTLMRKLKSKARNHGKVRLTGRNALETLNDLLRALNPALAKNEQLNPVKTPRDLYALQQKIKSLSVIRGNSNSTSPPKPSIQKVEVPKPVLQALSVIATNAWRARNKMVNTENGEAKEEMKRVYRHVEAVFDALSQIGIEIRDMQGHPYDSGMALKVISFEPSPGLSKEEIMETIKPTILWQNQLIQIGEVIVGTPKTK